MADTTIGTHVLSLPETITTQQYVWHVTCTKAMSPAEQGALIFSTGFFLLLHMQLFVLEIKLIILII